MIGSNGCNNWNAFSGKMTGFPIFSVLTAKSRKLRLALARWPPRASQSAINLQILFYSIYLYSVKKLGLKSIFVALKSKIMEIGRGSHRLVCPTAAQNLTCLYSYLDETCIYHIPKDWALRLFFWPVRAFWWFCKNHDRARTGRKNSLKAKSFDMW